MDAADKKRFYNSADWKRKRREILERDHHECVDCRQRIQSTRWEDLQGWQRKLHAAKQVHHVIELEERPDLALDDENLVALCVMCHNVRHGRDPFHFKAERRKKSNAWSEEW